MSYPILYGSQATVFENNGIGILGDCVSCMVTEEANGAYELTMQYPMDGIHFESIVDRCIIKAKPNQISDPQLFRVYAISKPMSGIVTISAQHISYDLSGVPVSPFTASNVVLALEGLRANAAVPHTFDFWTDKNTAANFTVGVPASIRSRLGGVAGSILDVYGGELEFDNFTVKLHNSRGQNRGVSVRYGKNLTDIQQDRNCAAVYTGVYPYWASAEGDVLVTLPEKIVNLEGNHGFTNIKMLDLSMTFMEQPTEEQVRTYTQNYINANNIGVPNVSLTVSFAQLEQYDEYKETAMLERVSLFDTVNVEFPALNVSATAKAVRMVYNVLLDRVESVTLGSVKANIADTVAEQKQEIEKKPSVTQMERAIQALTNTILGASGGSVRLLDTNGDGEPDTLYIADNPDPALAVKVWRFNYEGWAASKNGYNGTFVLGATLDNGLIADFITAGTLSANLIRTGVLSSADGKTTFDISSGRIVSKQTYAGSGYAVETEIGNGALKVRLLELDGTVINEGSVYYTMAFAGTEYAEPRMIVEAPNTDLYITGQNIRLTDGSVYLSQSNTPVYFQGKQLYWSVASDGKATLMGE